MSRRIPGVRLPVSLLPAEPIGPDTLFSSAVEKAKRLARTDSREQFYSIATLTVGDPQVQDLARLLSSYRRRLDGVGRVSVEPWHDSEDGVHVIVHQAQERQK